MRNRRKELELKKKELKEDVFVESVTKAWEKTSSARNYIIAGVVGLVVIAVAMSFVSRSRESSAQQGWNALAMAENRLEDQKTATKEADAERLQDKRLEEFAGLSKETDGSPAQPVVLFYYANDLFKKGGVENAKKAEEQCKLFISKYPKHYFTLQMQQLLAKTQLEQKNYEGARQSFETVRKALAEKAGKFAILEPEAVYYIGRCLELTGKPAEARKTYEELSTEESPLWAELAQYRLSKMGS